MLDVAILVLRLLIVALLYAFLFVVMRMALQGLHGESRSVLPRREQRLRLLILDGGASGLPAGEVVQIGHGGTFGRAERASVVIADSAVSSEHARVERLGRAWTISDLGSTNGTLVNDALIGSGTELAEGDVVALGTVRLQVLAQ